MIKVYTLKNGYLTEKHLENGSVKFGYASWIDVSNPTQEEKVLVESYFNVSIPSANEIDDIEVSKRFYNEDKTHYLTAYVLSSDQLGHFQSNSVRFILVKSVLVTVRYIEITPFIRIGNNLIGTEGRKNGERVLLYLLTSTIYHLGDILEQIGFSIDLQTKEILHNDQDTEKGDAFKVVLRNISRNGDATSKARESLISINRLITYVIQDANFTALLKTHMNILAKDILALNDHTFFLSNQINFLLEATLGMINIEQNSAMKIFSIASMMFLPPTLIASIYGMNFAKIPGLTWKYGYVWAIFLMLLSAYLPYKYFKKRGWF